MRSWIDMDEAPDDLLPDARTADGIEQTQAECAQLKPCGQSAQVSVSSQAVSRVTVSEACALEVQDPTSGEATTQIKHLANHSEDGTKQEESHIHIPIITPAADCTAALGEAKLNDSLSRGAAPVQGGEDQKVEDPLGTPNLDTPAESTPAADCSNDIAREALAAILSAAMRSVGAARGDNEMAQRGADECAGSNVGQAENLPTELCAPMSKAADPGLESPQSMALVLAETAVEQNSKGGQVGVQEEDEGLRTAREDFWERMGKQQWTFEVQLGQLQQVVLKQLELTGENPLKDEMIASVVGAEQGTNRKRNVLRAPALEALIRAFSIKDTVTKAEASELAFSLGVTPLEVRDFFTEQRGHVRRFLQQAQGAQPALAHHIIYENEAEQLEGAGVTGQEARPSEGEAVNLDVFLDPESGGLLGVEVVRMVVRRMKSTKTVAGRLELAKALAKTGKAKCLQRLIEVGCLKPLHHWVLAALAEEQTSLLRVLLRALRRLPVHTLKASSPIGRSVARIQHYFAQDIAELARLLVRRWRQHCPQQVQLRPLEREQPKEQGPLVKKAPTRAWATPKEATKTATKSKSIKVLPISPAAPLRPEGSKLRHELSKGLTSFGEPIIPSADVLAAQARSPPTRSNGSMALAGSAPKLLESGTKRPGSSLAPDHLKQRRISRVQVVDIVTGRSRDDASCRGTQELKGGDALKAVPVEGLSQGVKKVEKPILAPSVGRLDAAELENFKRRRPALLPKREDSKSLEASRDGREGSEPTVSERAEGEGNHADSEPADAAFQMLLQKWGKGAGRESQRATLPGGVAGVPLGGVSSREEEELLQRQKERAAELLAADRIAAKAMEFMKIDWRTPEALSMTSEWEIAAGEDSKEVAIQVQRTRWIQEATYADPSEIPETPDEPWSGDVPYDDSLTPVISLDQEAVANKGSSAGLDSSAIAAAAALILQQALAAKTAPSEAQIAQVQHGTSTWPQATGQPVDQAAYPTMQMHPAMAVPSWGTQAPVAYTSNTNGQSATWSNGQYAPSRPYSDGQVATQVWNGNGRQGFQYSDPSHVQTSPSERPYPAQLQGGWQQQPHPTQMHPYGEVMHPQPVAQIGQPGLSYPGQQLDWRQQHMPQVQSSAPDVRWQGQGNTGMPEHWRNGPPEFAPQDYSRGPQYSRPW